MRGSQIEEHHFLIYTRGVKIYPVDTLSVAVSPLV
jgi:hypothetical protein